MARREVPLGLGGIAVPLGSHIASFYRNLSELRRIAVPFILKGLEQGDRCICVVYEETRDGLQGSLQDQGVDVEAALESGQLSILTAEETYLSPGYFNPEKMLEFYESALRTAIEEGYRVIRATGEMAWALEERPGVGQLVEYEAKLNRMLATYPQVTLCLYNLTRFRGDTVMDVLKVHPVCIVGDALIYNHFYIPPDEFLRQLEAQTD